MTYRLEVRAMLGKLRALPFYNKWIRFSVTQANPAIQEGPIELPSYVERISEPLPIKKARLQYQSRRRGILEMDLLLSTFFVKHINSMTEEQLTMYDRLINEPTSDWDIFYWATGQREVPAKYQNEVMDMFRAHTMDNDYTTRLKQPDLMQFQS